MEQEIIDGGLCFKTSGRDVFDVLGFYCFLNALKYRRKNLKRSRETLDETEGSGGQQPRLNISGIWETMNM